MGLSRLRHFCRGYEPDTQGLALARLVAIDDDKVELSMMLRRGRYDMLDVCKLLFLSMYLAIEDDREGTATSPSNPWH